MVSVADCVTSFIDGRVRLRHPALRDAATADMAAAVIGGVEGVESVRVNPLTGSLLIFYDAETLSRERLLELAEQFDPPVTKSCLNHRLRRLLELAGTHTKGDA